MTKIIDFYIDRGGTFTDIVFHVTDTSMSGPEAHTYGTYKLLSSDPDHYPDAPSEGIKRVLIQQGLLDPSHSHDTPIPTDNIGEIKMGTTVATNALLEHKGAKCALLVTKGFKDVLEIGNQSRPHIFKLNIVKSLMLYQEVVEVEERLRLVGEEEANTSTEGKIIKGPTGLTVEDIVPVNEEAVKSQLEAIFAKGIRSVAISFIHAYAFGGHEATVAKIARAIGFTQVSVSHELMPLIKYVNRTTTATVDAYLTPLIAEYISNFRKRFANNLDSIFEKVYFIQSDGGLTQADKFYGYQAVLSGPAGGVVGCGATACSDLGEDSQVIGFDMGGTSTDVCRCDGRTIDHVLEAQIAGVTLQAPQVNVVTVAAGGGSVLFWSNGMFEVGPESAGAYPGPACYGRGGPLAVTDANVILGRVDPNRFPKVFGKSGSEPLFVDEARKQFEALTERINKDLDKQLSVEEVAMSFLEVANETMCRAVRNVTETKGYRCAEHTLSVFGGAGGQHACAVARKLGMSKIYAHQKASYLSAVGIGMSDIVDDRLAPLRRPLSGNGEVILALTERLQKESAAALMPSQKAKEQVEKEGSLSFLRFLSLRYEGTTTSLMIREPEGDVGNATSLEEAYVAALKERYQKEFGFPGKRGASIIVDEVRVRAILKSGANACFGARPANVDHPQGPKGYEEPYGNASVECKQIDTIRTFLATTQRWETVPIYEAAPNCAPVKGPSLVLMDGTFLVVEEGCIVYFTAAGNVIIHSNSVVPKLTKELHPLPLSLFAHRFMSIAEQMGYTLQRTATSTNIKERLDFSCAIFDGKGGLVANAPHIPVHLGAMGATIRWQRDHYGSDGWKEGEVLLSNHPSAGGSHLPDITVMTPCFINGKCAFYVASRGHHADVGGITPGSLPPFSTSLDEEGAHIKSFKLVQEGDFQEDGIIELLMAPGKRPAGTGPNALQPSGCRMLADVLADLRAQVAANHRGVELMKGLVASYGLDVVEAYMGHIQDAAEVATRSALREVVKRASASDDVVSPDGESSSSYRSVDVMDDGTVIDLTLTINKDEGSAVFDFTNTGPQVLGSTNCPKAVVSSAVIYSLRCLIERDIPLNEGCLKPITIITRPRSILEPSEDCAVVAGNVLTSQRVTDVILRALHAAACSQGCMNNLTMGNSKLAYYETIGGGAGATPTANGASAVQVHMTNTRMTDVEVFEERYPVMLREYSVRPHSGGGGKYTGGNGIIRSILFLTPMTLSLSCERRAVAPTGFMGGGNGKPGINLLLKGKAVSGLGSVTRSILWSTDEFTAYNVGGKCTLSLQPGDVVTVQTPGGGGFGSEK